MAAGMTGQIESIRGLIVEVKFHGEGRPALREIMARFAPYRSLATCHVWASLKGEHE